MNKRTVLVLAIIAAMAALVAGGTAAYFVSSERTHNIITTSGVAIQLIEDTDKIGADGRPIPFTNIDGAMPGDTISKIPKVKNVDDGDAYIRMKINVRATLADGSEVALDPNIFAYDILRSWSPRDGYYYLLRELHSGETTPPLFTTVKIPQDLADTYQHATFSLDVTAEAVQVANNGTNALDAEGWPEE